MEALRPVFLLGLLIGLGITIPGLPTTAQTASPKQGQLPAPGLRTLTGDELGYVSLRRGGVELLFRVFGDRYKRAGVLITSNLPFSVSGIRSSRVSE